MTLEEVRELIKQKENELKELKRQRDIMLKQDLLKEERKNFYKRQEEIFKTLKYDKALHIQRTYAGFDKRIDGITSGRYFASCAWKQFRLKATRLVKGHDCGLISCTEKEIEKIKKVIKELEEQMVKDMKES